MGQPDLGAEAELNSIGGVNVAAVTPRGRDGHEVDAGSTLELIDFLCDAGVAGIALLGSTGEFLNLTFDERVRLVYMAARRSRVPLLVGVAHASLDGAVVLARQALEHGVAGLLLMPPYFFRYRQEDIKEFYLRFMTGVGAQAKVYLYNIPFFTNPLACDTAIELLATGRFAGIKDSSGSFEDFLRLREFRERQPFTLLVGNDVIFTRARQAGADGVVSGVACAVPELMLSLDQAIRAGNDGETRRLEAKLQEFIAWLNRFPVPVGVKVATELRGLKIGPPAVPLPAESQRTLDEFKEWFRGWLPEVQRGAANA